MEIKIIRAREQHRKEINRLIIGTRIGGPIKEPIKNFLIARVDGKTIGCAALECIGNGAAVFTHCAVQEEFRKKGIGSALVAERLRMARKKGIKILALVTMYYRFRFYKKRGFRTCPRAELPECVRNYWMFTEKKYKKCAVMIRKESYE